jgi:hypothetical protein
MSTNKILGYVILWRIPDLDVRYDEAAQIALDASFDPAFVPTAPKKRGAWEKATNLGAAGLKVMLPPDKIDQIKQKYGVEPVCRLETEVIKRSAPHLVRHIVRKLAVPTVRDEHDKRKLAEQQLSSQTVCIMEFDTDLEVMRSTSYNELHDEQGFVNGNLLTVVKQIEDRVDQAKNRADGDLIRNGVRGWLISRAATLMSSGGAYFIPWSDNAFEDLKTLKVYVEGLADYRVNKTERPPQVTVIPLSDSGEAFEARLDIASNAVEAFKGELQAIVNELQPVLKAERSETVAGNIRRRATISFMELNAKLAKYREALDDNLTALDHQLQMVQAAIVAAQSAQYKVKATAEGEE